MQLFWYSQRQKQGGCWVDNGDHGFKGMQCRSETYNEQAPILEVQL